MFFGVLGYRVSPVLEILGDGADGDVAEEAFIVRL
jgi:hypothetical protein